MPDLADRVRRLVERVAGGGGGVEPRPGEVRVGTGLGVVTAVEAACGARLLRSAAVVDRSGDGLPGREAAGRETAGREALAQAMGLVLGGTRASVLLAAADVERSTDLLRRAAELRLPLTVHAVGADGVPSPGAGWVHLAAADVQETADFAAVAHHLAEAALAPVLVSMDGPGTAHALSDHRLPPDDLVAAFVGAPGQLVHPRTPAQGILFGDHRPRIPRWHDVERPLLAGALPDGALPGGAAVAAAELAGERFFARHLPELVDEALAAWGELTGRHHRPLSTFRLRGAKLVLVTTGAAVGIAQGVAEHLRRNRGPKVGVLGIRALAPLPETAFVEALPSGARLVVLERSSASDGDEPPLASRVRALLGRGLSDLLAVGLLLAAGVVGGRDGRPARLVGGQQLVDQRRVLATGALGVTDEVRVLAEQLEIDHASTLAIPLRRPSDAEQLEEGVLLEHPGRVDGGGDSPVRIGARLEEDPDDLAVALEHGTGQRGLPPVVGPLHVGTPLDQRTHGSGMTVVGGQHEQPVPALIGQVGGHAGVDVGRQSFGFALSRQLEQHLGELEDLGIHPFSGRTGAAVRSAGLLVAVSAHARDLIVTAAFAAS